MTAQFDRVLAFSARVETTHPLVPICQTLDVTSSDHKSMVPTGQRWLNTGKNVVDSNLIV